MVIRGIWRVLKALGCNSLHQLAWLAFGTTCMAMESVHCMVILKLDRFTRDCLKNGVTKVWNVKHVLL